MRLGRKSIFSVRKTKPRHKKVTVFLAVLLFVMLVVYSVSFFVTRLRPVMISLAEAKAHNIAVAAINDAVISIFSAGSITYDDIITLEKNNEGSIVAAKSNLVGVSRLKALLTEKIREDISNDGISGITVPMGTLFADDIFAGLGPYIHIPLMPFGTAEVDFESEFSESGINQTRLTINLHVKTDVQLLIPTAHTVRTVETDVPVIQTIIVGEVPGSYTNVERSGENFEDDVLQLAE